MRVQLTIFVFCACVPQVLSQFNPAFMMSMLNPDIKLPPSPPRSIFPRYYLTRQQLRQRQLEQRRQQEMLIYRRLQNMTEEQILNLRKTLTKSQVHQLVQRLKYIKQHQQQGGSGGAGVPAAASGSASASASGSGSSPNQQQGGPNMVLSGASRVRIPGSGGFNSVSGSHGGAAGARGRLSSSSSSSSYVSRGRYSGTASKAPMHPMVAMKYLTKYRKKGLRAMTLGCSFPLRDPVNSFFAFARGGCRGGGSAICFMQTMSCLDVEKSALCCPPGFTTATLDAFSYMKQMQAFMQQFQ